jgi:ATP-dependent RNA helicase DDX19/DBP5
MDRNNEDLSDKLATVKLTPGTSDGGEPASDEKISWADMADDIDEPEIVVHANKLLDEHEDEEDEKEQQQTETAAASQATSGGSGQQGQQTNNNNNKPDSKLSVQVTDASGQATQVEVPARYTSSVTFEQLGIKAELLQGIYEMKFVRPSKIQATAIPAILSTPMKHLIAQAQSGTGKTAAFTLGMLSRIDTTQNYPQALCLCPTRELARQLYDVIRTIGRYTNAKLTLAIRAASRNKLDSHVVVGTPGTVWDYIKAPRNQMFDPRLLKVLVLDEADFMLDKQGLAPQTIRIRKTLSPACQILLFSATYSPQVAKYAETVVPHPHMKIRLQRQELSLEQISQYFVDCRNSEDRYGVLSDFYATLRVGQTIIFVARRETAMALGRRMREEGHAISVLHGEMEPEQRDKVLDDFRDGKTKVLISTNVLARGIDIFQVSLIVNYDLPVDKTGRPEYSTYLHRIGRTGRWTRAGIALNFVYDDKTRRTLHSIDTFFHGDNRRIKKLDPNNEAQVRKLEDELAELEIRQNEK